MEENKYYIPEANEFHIGFTYEFRPRLRQGIMSYVSQKFEYVDWWKTQEIGKGPENLIDALNDYNDPFSIDDVMSFHKDGMVRVKHLDKQDLTELGFEYTEQYPIILDIRENLFVKKSNEFEDFIITMKDNNINISVKKDILLMAIPSDKKHWDLYCLFSGRIKNKSELIKVLKMLGIK